MAQTINYPSINDIFFPFENAAMYSAKEGKRREFILYDTIPQSCCQSEILLLPEPKSSPHLELQRKVPGIKKVWWAIPQKKSRRLNFRRPI
jgi:hypothetical protein